MHGLTMFIIAFRVIFLMKLRWPQNESHTCHFFVAGEIGGQLGLSIGASLLSLLEFLDVVFSIWSTYVLVLPDEHVSLGYLTTGSVFIQYCITSC